MSGQRNGQPGITPECAEFQERLPQLFGADADLAGEAHLKTCENCAELVRDLEYIAQQAKLLMPIHDPSPAVWSNIKNALDNPEQDGK
jgi:hypothetical protein